MSHGLPIIAQDACAIPEMVVHGLNGFLIKKRDDLREKDHALLDNYLSENILKYLEDLIVDGALRKSMGKEARKCW